MAVLVKHLWRADVGGMQPAVPLGSSRGRVFSSLLSMRSVLLLTVQKKHNRSLSACSLTGCFTGLAADVLTCVCDAVCVYRVALRNFVDGLDGLNGSFSLRMKQH